MKTSIFIYAWFPALAFGAIEPEMTVEAQDARVFIPETLIRVEKMTVRPENEDLGPLAKSRWVKFEEALGPGRSASRRYTSYGWRNNDGSRMECCSPCVINCCVDSGGFSLLGAGFGR